MAAREGEENVGTFFGDIHYFYGPPTNNPPHHRFDKGSYVYLFEDANYGRARLEVANQPGREDQDAFDGYLDRTHLEYDYNHTCLVTLTVGEVDGHEEWHLPTYDPHNQAKYHYKLHSLDIYFHNQQDALQFVNGIRRVLPPHQCDVHNEPGPPPRHDTEVSAVVQQLERAAIGDHGTPPTTLSQPPQVGGIPSFSPPPMSAVSASYNHSTPSPQAFVPMAYNPAAPPAAEPVRYREKTPPPEDAAVNPLHQTLAYDATTPFSPGLPPPSGRGPLSPGIPPPNLQHPPGAPTFAAPPQHSVTSPGFAPQGFGALGGGYPTGLSQPPVHPGVQRSITMPAGLPSPGLASPGFASPYGQGYPAQPASVAAVGGYGAVPPTPTPPGAGYGAAPSPIPPSMQQGAGYGQNVAGQSEYSVHHQLYVPEQKKGRLEEGAGKLERGVTGMLKKFEKKFG
ncbi:hypothetical protein B0H65DRAFT_453729 [Neurospora tetraspora]|uniref:Uncharacterized protein n=1 Tax=Neurospora tetraspora TaxID=94610 RepID=A0AAE0JRB5_9PEZI|nr:hypothetical protein B0H65DRAFT_453729 [Neurospora tetraspora]